MSEATKLETLGDLIDQGYGLEGSCYPCKRFAPIDPRALAKRLGRDFVFISNLDGKLRCKQCGQKTVRVNLAPPTS